MSGAILSGTFMGVRARRIYKMADQWIHAQIMGVFRDEVTHDSNVSIIAQRKSEEIYFMTLSQLIANRASAIA